MRASRLVPAVAVAAATALALSACGSGSSGGSGGGGGDSEPASITVWLQTDAQQGWAESVDAATKAFTTKHPKTTVKVEYQTWADHLTKLDAALAGKTPPDVVELGNTETTKYMAAGALAQLDKGTFENSGTWLQGLADAGSYDGALYLRRDCTDQTTELACNDDSTDNHHSYIEATLDRGTYYVVVDGFRTGNVGTYTLSMQTANAL